MTRQEALEVLSRYGIDGVYVYLIDVIPLIEILWADGKNQKHEKDVLIGYIEKQVERINRAACHQVISLAEAKTFVSKYVCEMPNQGLLAELRKMVEVVVFQGENAEALRDSMLCHCLDIGANAVSLHPYEGYDKRFTLEEKKCFFEILESVGCKNA